VVSKVDDLGRTNLNANVSIFYAIVQEMDVSAAVGSNQSCVLEVST